MKIYTDGACRGNGKQENWGAWSFVVVVDDRAVHSMSGSSPQTTNNKMELAAAINALTWLQEYQQTNDNTIVSDSQYVIRGITDWIHGWIKKGWKNSMKKPVENKQQWEILHDLNTMVKPTWEWVRGHGGDKYNEMCDKMCNDTLDFLN